MYGAMPVSKQTCTRLPYQKGCELHRRSLFTTRQNNQGDHVKGIDDLESVSISVSYDTPEQGLAPLSRSQHCPPRLSVNLMQCVPVYALAAGCHAERTTGRGEQTQHGGAEAPKEGAVRAFAHECSRRAGYTPGGRVHRQAQPQCVKGISRLQHVVITRSIMTIIITEVSLKFVLSSTLNLDPKTPKIETACNHDQDKMSIPSQHWEY